MKTLHLSYLTAFGLAGFAGVARHGTTGGHSAAVVDSGQGFYSGATPAIGIEIPS